MTRLRADSVATVCALAAVAIALTIAAPFARSQTAARPTTVTLAAASATSEALERAKRLEAELAAARAEREAALRQAAEAAKQAEQLRRQAEETARLAEQARQAAEAAKKASEAARAERDAALRQAAEATTQAQQAVRQSEQSRQAAAAAAKEAEAARQQAEEAGKLAETAKKEADASRAERDAAKKETASATQAAQQAEAAARAARYELALNRGDALFREQKYEPALAEFRQAAQTIPERPTAHIRVADCLWNLQRFDEAEAAALKLFEISPTASTVNYVLRHARLRVEAKQYDRAAELLAPARAWAPNDINVLYWLTRLHNEKNEHDATIQAGAPGLEAFLAQHKETAADKLPQPYFVQNLAAALAAKGALADAVAKHEKSFEGRAPTAAEGRALAILAAARGNQLRDEKKPQEAIAFLQKALDQTPTDIQTHRWLGFALRDAGEFDKAVALMKSCIDKGFGKEDTGIRSDLAYYLEAAKHHGEAVEAFRELARREKNADRYLDNIVNNLNAAGDRRGAAAEVAAALERIEAADPSAYKTPDERAQAIYGFETKHLETLDNGGFIEELIRRHQREALTRPRDAALRAHLAALYLRMGDWPLALREHLAAATITGNPEPYLFNTFAQLKQARQYLQAHAYVNALLDHFCEHPCVFRALDEMMSAQNSPWIFVRFGPEPEGIDILLRAAAACRRIEASGAPPDMKFEATLRRIDYAAARQVAYPSVWQAARREYEALMARPGVTPDQRRRVVERIVTLELERLNNKPAALRAAEELAKAEPSRENMLLLASTARRVDTLPPPALLRAFVEKNPQDHELKGHLALWLWDRGERDDARKLAADVPEENRKNLSQYGKWILLSQ